MSAVISDVIPKERLSAYQRWEVASLTSAAAGAAGRSATPAEPEPAAARAAEIDALRGVAKAEGRALGRVEGLSSAAADIARLKGLLQSLGSAVLDHEQRMADAVLDLALALARRLAGEALTVRRELLLPVITDALTQLPEATQRVRLHLAADDIELVRTLMDAHPGIATCQLVADAAVAPGGFLLETELCNVDATLSARWKRLAASLGRSYEWIDHT